VRQGLPPAEVTAPAVIVGGGPDAISESKTAMAIGLVSGAGVVECRRVWAEPVIVSISDL
jgi:hypothetical protein